MIAFLLRSEKESESKSKSTPYGTHASMPRCCSDQPAAHASSSWARFFYLFAYESRASISWTNDRTVIECGCFVALFILWQLTWLHRTQTHTPIENHGEHVRSMHGNCPANRVLCQFSLIYNSNISICTHKPAVYYCLRILSTKLNPILDLSTNQNAWSIAAQKHKICIENEIDTHIHTHIRQLQPKTKRKNRRKKPLNLHQTQHTVKWEDDFFPSVHIMRN